MTQNELWFIFGSLTGAFGTSAIFLVAMLPQRTQK